ncbi:hypothetical protein H6F78_25590 [Coleofasciculus sp. FACHB-64]|uniref:hypothetical protein n=1 Tax=Cyanophyceae TaxID=3028117 RepID=UPI00168A13A0|nr:MULTISPECIES: hypothetical protein [unclassified Coleofasciculus]MBD1841504.1 hypothetical protein [Coleofasciculus sp. FACHB-501]MBD2048930.1 hypothetical protein [Coleofasciculus sp. FACHB-64]
MGTNIFIHKPTIGAAGVPPKAIAAFGSTKRCILDYDFFNLHSRDKLSAIAYCEVRETGGASAKRFPTHFQSGTWQTAIPWNSLSPYLTQANREITG